MNFVSAGLRKTATEEKRQKEEGSDDSDGSGPSAPPLSRGTAPKKLQMVNIIFLSFKNMVHCIMYVVTKCIFPRVILGVPSTRGLQVAYRRVKV